MGSLQLPVIDFSSLDCRNSNSTSEWESVKVQVLKAFEEYGCFEALCDTISTESREAISNAAKEFFNLPLQAKLRIASKKPNSGYTRQNPQGPFPETMCVDGANVVEQVQGMTSVVWPEGNPSFSKTILSFSEQVLELDQIVRRMIVESLGLEKYMEEHMSSTNYCLRVIKYEGSQTDESEVGLKAHTDKHVVTILYRKQADGLEVQTKDGRWINVKQKSDSFIVMIGDCFHAWTNGRLHSPYHHVMMSGTETRYSITLFSIPKANYIIEIPEELIDEENPLLFKPFDHDKFVEFFFTEAGQKAQSALKTYCGA